MRIHQFTLRLALAQLIGASFRALGLIAWNMGSGLEQNKRKEGGMSRKQGLFSTVTALSITLAFSAGDVSAKIAQTPVSSIALEKLFFKCADATATTVRDAEGDAAASSVSAGVALKSRDTYLPILDTDTASSFDTGEMGRVLSSDGFGVRPLRGSSTTASWRCLWRWWGFPETLN